MIPSRCTWMVLTVPASLAGAGDLRGGLLRGLPLGLHLTAAFDEGLFRTAQALEYALGCTGGCIMQMQTIWLIMSAWD